MKVAGPPRKRAKDAASLTPHVLKLSSDGLKPDGTTPQLQVPSTLKSCVKEAASSPP